jgi:DNA-binding NarL/FixJ family response regulator
VRKGSGTPPALVIEIVDDEHAIFSWRVDTVRDPLTTAEADVLKHVIAGASNDEIARARSTAVRTVANQVASLLRKLGATSRYDLIRRFGAQHESGS